jgi:hypothetical protein
MFVTNALLSPVKVRQFMKLNVTFPFLQKHSDQ